jgi:ABC-type transport system involved in multi-copper enzyme maturation permease subunit
MIQDDRPAPYSRFPRFLAIVKYELLWNIRKKKMLGLLVLVFGLATFSLVLPVILSTIYDRPLEADPSHVIHSGAILGGLGFFLLAVVTSMNTISGEFESGTIVPLLTKPVSRTVVFLGKLFATFLTLLVTYTLLFAYLAVGGSIVYGPQNNLHLVVVTLLGSVFSTFVWVAIVLAIGTVSKSSVTAALGAFGIWLGLNLAIGIFSIFSGETWILTYIPGGGATGYLNMGEAASPMAGPAVKTGTGSIAENLVTLILNPTAEVNFIKFELTGGAGPRIIEVFTETLSYVVMRSLLVASVYIFTLSFIAWFALKRAQITE